MHLFMSDLHKDNNTMYFFKKKNPLQQQQTIKSRNKLKPEGPVKPALSAIHVEWHLQKSSFNLDKCFFLFEKEDVFLIMQRTEKHNFAQNETVFG